VGIDGVERIVVRLDGVEVGSVRPSMPRPDVDAAHRRPGARGFAVRCAVPRALRWDAAILEVAAISSGGVATPIFLGSLHAAHAASVATQVATARAALREREGWFAHVERELLGMVAARAARLQAIGRSRFWRARQVWFRLKRQLGLTTEA
jgi:hypothetical protein